MSNKMLKLRVSLSEKTSVSTLSKVLGKKPISKSPEEFKQTAIDIAKGFPGFVSLTSGKILKDNYGELYVILEISGDLHFDPVNLGLEIRRQVGHADIVTWGD